MIARGVVAGIILDLNNGFSVLIMTDDLLYLPVKWFLFRLQVFLIL